MDTQNTKQNLLLCLNKALATFDVKNFDKFNDMLYQKTALTEKQKKFINQY